MKKNGRETFDVYSFSGVRIGTMENVTGKRAERINDTRHDDNGQTLHDVYGRFSAAKQAAYNYCVRLCYALRGDTLRIVSHNAQFFSVKFNFINPETGVLSVALITPSHNYYADATTEYCEQFPYSFNDFAKGYTEQ